MRQNSYLRRAEAEEDSFCVCENSVLIGLQRARGEVGLRKKRNFILAAVGTVVVLAVCFGYGHFVSNKIYEESTSHLREVYSQVNKTFTSLVSRNWSLLSDWSYYINHTIEAGEENEIQEYLDSGRGEWGFTQFYFLNCDGSYLTIQGERGTLDFGEQMNDLVIQKKNVVMDSMQPGGGALTVFAIPVKQKSYKGFDYCAIAISYNNEDMEQVLDVSAFSDKSDCYVVYPDGKILFAAETKEEQPYNYLTFMEENSDLKDDQLDQIRRDMESGVEGMIQFRMTGREQYLSYQPVDFQDWVLLGIVPQQVVNASMNQVQLVTVILLTAVFLLIAEVGLVAVVRRGRKNLRDKELELKYREQLFGVVVDNMPDIFAMFSPGDYSVEYLSPNVERLLGIPAEEIRKDLSALAFSAVSREEELTSEEMKRIPVGGSLRCERERIHQKTGQRQWYQETLYHMDIEGREKFILIMADRTKERQDRERLDMALDIARSANEAKSSFLSNMSHDIRTPMNAIVGFAMLLERDMNQPGKVQEYARKITISSQHLLNLINDVLDMSKIESGKTTLNLAEFSFSGLLKDLDTVIRPQTGAKGQSFQIQVTGLKQDKFLGDKLRISQILLNLLSNSIKYTPENGSVLLSIRPLERPARGRVGLHFEIRDNGIGMSEEFLATIFEPFNREQNTTISGIQGTGLGMAITKNLVELMGGNISVESRLGEGTCFFLDLELRAAEEDENLRFWRQSGIRRILAVDDEEEFCLSVRELLSETGVEIRYTTGGREAVRAVEYALCTGRQYQVILIGWRMPEIDGLETARRIREKTGEDTLILLSAAHGWSEIEAEAKKAGVDAFLPKPFWSPICGRRFRRRGKM